MELSGSFTCEKNSGKWTYLKEYCGFKQVTDGFKNLNKGNKGLVVVVFSLFLQLYNADETGLYSYWNQLSNKTYVAPLENSTSGAKIEKQRLTCMGYSKALDTDKLNLLVIGNYW